MPTRALREPLPRFVDPMLALAGLPSGDDGWAVEVKWDGIRGQLRVDRGRWCLRSRPGRDCSDTFPELAELADALRRRRVLLDGELVHLGVDGKPDFAALRRRLGACSDTAAARAASSAPAKFVVFDVLHADGRAVRQLPYIARRELLEELIQPGPRWCVSEHWIGRLADVLAVTQDHGLEGVVCKRLGSSYEAGRRSGAWLKHKHRRRELLAVTGWMPGDGQPDTIYVARMHPDGDVTPAGGVQLGLGRDERHRLREALIERELPSRRRIRNVRPGIQVAVDAHGPPDGILRDPIVRQVLIEHHGLEASGASRNGRTR